MAIKIKEPKFKYNHVLLIDDNELDNFINEKIIESNLFSKKVYVTTSAKSAIEFLQNMLVMGSKVNKHLPEVIFIDINMPLMDGFQFADYFIKNIQNLLNPTKLVILTSSVYKEDREKADMLSKDILFLNKPLSIEMLENI